MAGLFRRGKIYWARAQREGRDFRRSLETADRRIAEERLRYWLEELNGTKWGKKPRRSFDEATERFIQDHLPTIKHRSAERYGSSLKHLARHFGGKRLHEITSAELSEFETLRRSEGVRPGTIRRDLACLSSLMTSATDWEWVDANPVPSYLRRRSKRELKEAPPRTRYLTEGEEELLLEAATPGPRETIQLAIDTGLRREELFSLTWPQVDLTRGVITTTTKTKSGRPRMVPCPPRSAQILMRFPRYLETTYVIVNPETRTRYWQMNKGFKRAVARAGFLDVRWHDLRRTAGCRWLARDGRTMAEVCMLLGHSSIQVTESRYAFLDAEAVAESVSGRTKAGTAAGGKRNFT